MFHDPLIILGMHRSGTSVITRLCNLLGVELGDGLFPPREDNPKGFWEKKAIFQLNEKIFQTFHLTSQDVVSLPDGWLDLPEIIEIESKLTEVLKEFDSKPLWGFKDPRVGKLLPLWKRIFASINVTPRYLIPLRHPTEVAASLVKRDGILFERGVLMWLQYNLSIEYETRGAHRAFVSFPHILGQWQEDMARVAEQLQISWSVSMEAAAEEAEAFTERDLVHHAADDSQLPRLVIQVYTALMKGVTGEVDKSLLDEIRGMLEYISVPFDETVRALKPNRGAWRNNAGVSHQDVAKLQEKIEKLEKKKSISQYVKKIFN